MKIILTKLKSINKQTVEQLFMSAISGLLVSRYLVFSLDVVNSFKGNFFLGFALMFLTIYIISYYIKNLRKYFLQGEWPMALFIFTAIASYFIFK